MTSPGDRLSHGPPGELSILSPELPRQSQIRIPKSEIAVAPTYRLRCAMDSINMPPWRPAIREARAFADGAEARHATRDYDDGRQPLPH